MTWHLASVEPLCPQTLSDAPKLSLSSRPRVPFSLVGRRPSGEGWGSFTSSVLWGVSAKSKTSGPPGFLWQGLGVVEGFSGSQGKVCRLMKCSSPFDSKRG